MKWSELGCIVSYKEGFDPKIIRAVVREVSSGQELLSLDRSIVVSSNGWALSDSQADILFALITRLKQQSEDWIGGAGVRRLRVWCQFRLHYFEPRCLFSQTISRRSRKARASRYPYETALLCLSGWNQIEKRLVFQSQLSQEKSYQGDFRKNISMMKNHIFVGKPLIRHL